MHRSKFMVRLFLLAGVSSLALAAGVQAQTEELLSFTYSDLDGDYTAIDSTSGLFTAANDGDSDGDVTRLTPATGDAFFGGPGLDPFDGSGAFSISMNVSSVGPVIATGLGTITLTDIDGDTYSGSIFGTWINVAGSANFVGLLTNIMPTDNGAADGKFNGDAGLFDLSFPDHVAPFSGNVITLAFQNWFEGGTFSNATTLASGAIVGAIVPEPATLGLLLVGGVIAGLRIRRKD